MLGPWWVIERFGLGTNGSGLYSDDSSVVKGVVILHRGCGAVVALDMSSLAYHIMARTTEAHLSPMCLARSPLL